jgi:hypothetical protein
MDAKGLSEVVKNYFQIIAILVAAVWTIYVFYGKEAPLLETRTNITNNLVTEVGYIPNACDALFNVTIQNTGVGAFDVERVQIRAWSLDPEKMSTPYYDYTTGLGSENLVTDKSYVDTDPAAEVYPLVGHYPTGTGRHHTFVWELPRQPPRMLYARVDIFQNKNDSRPSWYVVETKKIECEPSSK